MKLRRRNKNVPLEVFVSRDAKKGTESANITFVYGKEGMLFSSKIIGESHKGYESLMFQYKVIKET